MTGGSNTGTGVLGYSTQGNGIYGSSASNSNSAIWGNNSSGGDGVSGTSANGIGVRGVVTNSNPAVMGTNNSTGSGILGTSVVTGVAGIANDFNAKGYGVYGRTESDTGAGVYGRSPNGYQPGVGGGIGVYGLSDYGYGVKGETTAGSNINTSAGVYGLGGRFDAPGVKGVNLVGGYGIYGDNGNSNSNGYAGDFNGRVNVTQDLTTNGLTVNANGTTLKKVESGTATIGSNGSASTVITITFPSAFSAVPKIAMTARNDDSFPDVDDTFVVSTRRISASQVVVNVVRVDSASGWSQNLMLDWFAWE